MSTSGRGKDDDAPKEVVIDITALSARRSTPPPRPPKPTRVPILVSMNVVSSSTASSEKSSSTQPDADAIESDEKLVRPTEIQLSVLPSASNVSNASDSGQSKEQKVVAIDIADSLPDDQPQQSVSSAPSQSTSQVLARLSSEHKNESCCCDCCSSCWGRFTSFLKRKVVFFFPEVSPFKKFLTTCFSIGAAWVEYNLAIEIMGATAAMVIPGANSIYALQKAIQATSALSAAIAAYLTQKTLGTNFKEESLWADRMQGLSDKQAQLETLTAQVLQKADQANKKSEEELKAIAQLRKEVQDEKRVLDGVLRGLADWTRTHGLASSTHASPTSSSAPVVSRSASQSVALSPDEASEQLSAMRLRLSSSSV